MNLIKSDLIIYKLVFVPLFQNIFEVPPAVYTILYFFFKHFTDSVLLFLQNHS